MQERIHSLNTMAKSAYVRLAPSLINDEAEVERTMRALATLA